VKRLSLFAKGNVDVHDSLHSCVVAGELQWNGVNDILRQRHPGTLIRLKHETWTRSDALLAARGRVPDELKARELPLGAYPLDSQFSTALFETRADAIVLSIQPDTATGLLRRRGDGFLFYPNDSVRWPPADRAWLSGAFEQVAQLDVEASMANFEQIVERIRLGSEAPILIYNLSPIVPGEMVHCLQGMGETFATRIRRFNLGLADLSERTGVSIIDVDSLLARKGADRLKLDAFHLTAEGYRLIAEEVVRVLEDLGLLEPQEAVECASV
jgi:lysophospholipase L1-like esterase